MQKNYLKILKVKKMQTKSFINGFVLTQFKLCTFDL